MVGFLEFRKLRSALARTTQRVGRTVRFNSLPRKYNAIGRSCGSDVARTLYENPVTFRAAETTNRTTLDFSSGGHQMTDFSPAQMPEPQSGPAPEPAAAPRGKATVAFASIAVVFFLVAATFGTLWIIEHGDHKDTSSQLTTVRTEVEGERAKAKAAEAKTQAAEAKTQEAVNEQQKLRKTNESMQACVNAGKAIVKAILENNEAAVEAAGQDLALRCGTW